MAANGLMLLMFAFSVVVQVNDPDPVRWMLIYGAAALASLLAFRRGLRWWFPALIGVVALVWSASIAPRVLGQVPFRDMFAAFEMKNEGVEESREMYGLLLLGLWMVVLAARSAIQRSAIQRSAIQRSALRR
jgi:glucan phosphoethanolaminetransferase (alkaline phosphatase superfamily)